MKWHCALILLIFFTGCEKKKTTQELTDQMKAPDASLRLEAIKALEKRRSETSVVIPALKLGLKDENAFVRRDAAKALGKIGPEAEATVPALLGALNDKNLSVRTAAADALKKIDPTAATKAGIR